MQPQWFFPHPCYYAITKKIFFNFASGSNEPAIIVVSTFITLPTTTEVSGKYELNNIIDAISLLRKECVTEIVMIAITMNVKDHRVHAKRLSKPILMDVVRLVNAKTGKVAMTMILI
jgi:hypothetical protein